MLKLENMIAERGGRMRIDTWESMINIYVLYKSLVHNSDYDIKI